MKCVRAPLASANPSPGQVPDDPNTEPVYPESLARRRAILSDELETYLLSLPTNNENEDPSIERESLLQILTVAFRRMALGSATVIHLCRDQLCVQAAMVYFSRPYF